MNLLNVTTAERKKGQKMNKTYDVYFTNGNIGYDVEESTIILHLLNQTGIAYIKTHQKEEITA